MDPLPYSSENNRGAQKITFPCSGCNYQTNKEQKLQAHHKKNKPCLVNEYYGVTFAPKIY